MIFTIIIEVIAGVNNIHTYHIIQQLLCNSTCIYMYLFYVTVLLYVLYSSNPAPTTAVTVENAHLKCFWPIAKTLQLIRLHLASDAHIHLPCQTILSMHNHNFVFVCAVFFVCLLPVLPFHFRFSSLRTGTSLVV